MVPITSCPRCHRGTAGSPCAHCGARFASGPRTRGGTPVPGRHETPGGYRIEGPLATGGMAVVLRGRRLADGRPVVCKAPRSSRPRARRRFVREARALASTDHPCIVRLLDLDCTPHGTPLLVLDPAPGRPLRAVLNERRLEEEEFTGIAWSLASALGHCHRRGVVHRDVNPNNVMLAADRVTLIDFGLARVDAREPVRSRPSQLTPEATLLGTPPYVAPEQLVAPHAVGPAADVFSLGVLLRECRVRTRWRDPVRRSAWDAVLDRMIDRRGERRPAAEALVRWLADGRRRRTIVRHRRRRVRQYLAAALVAGVGAGLLVAAPLRPAARVEELTGYAAGPGAVDLVLRLPAGRSCRARPRGNTRVRLPDTAWTDRPLHLIGNRDGRVRLQLFDPDGRWRLDVER